MQTTIIDNIEKSFLREGLPEFRVGDTVRVHYRIREGEKERVQVFQGVVIKRHRAGARSTFTVRKVSYNIGVERVFLQHSPRIETIDVVSNGVVRRARLYYLRERSGKAARLRDAKDKLSPFRFSRRLRCPRCPRPRGHSSLTRRKPTVSPPSEAIFRCAWPRVRLLRVSYFSSAQRGFAYAAPARCDARARRNERCEAGRMIQCARCGGVNNPVDKFCMTCGARLDAVPGPPAGGPPPGYGAPGGPPPGQGQDYGGAPPGFGPPGQGGPPPGFGPPGGPGGFGPPPGQGGPPPGFGPPGQGGPPPGFGPPGGQGGPPPGFGPPGQGGPPPGFGPPGGQGGPPPGFGPPGGQGGPPPGFGPPGGQGGPPPGFGPPGGQGGPPPGFGPPGGQGGPPPGFGPPGGQGGPPPGFGPPPGQGGPPPGFGPPGGQGGPPPGFGPPGGQGGPPPGFGPPPGQGGPPPGFGPPPGQGGPPPGFGPPPGQGGPPPGFGPPPGQGGPPPGFGPPGGFDQGGQGGPPPGFGPPPGQGGPPPGFGPPGGPGGPPQGFGPPGGPGGPPPGFGPPGQPGASPYGPPPVNPFGPTTTSADPGVPMGGPGPSAPPPAPAPAPAAPVVLPPGKRELVGFLVSYQSDPAGTFFPLYGGRNLVGRAGASDTLDIAINDPTTSSNHAAIVIESATRAVHIEDLGSTNGTFLNEDALGPQGRRDARDNDRVRFGGYTLVLKVVYRP